MSEDVQKTLEQRIDELVKSKESEEIDPVSDDAEVGEGGNLTPEPTETPDQEPLSEEEPTEEAVVEEYVPNYKYKVYDEEHEFDESIRDFITKDNEELFRDLYTKAGGIDKVKERLNKSREELSSTSEKYSNLRSGVEKIQSMVESGNLEDLFHSLKIDDDKIYEYARKRIEYNEMSPEERKYYDNTINTRREAEEIRRRNEILEAQYQETLKQQHETEFNSVLESPTIKPFVDEFNNKFGAGSFEKEVSQTGYFMYKQNNNQDPTVAEAVNRTLEKFGYSDKQATTIQQAEPAKVKSAPARVTTIVNNKNTIPKTGAGSSESPVAKKITSIADLERLANEHIRRSQGR